MLARRVCIIYLMKDKLTHTKQDEWRYTTSKTSARKKVKRARQKAKRRVIAKYIKEKLNEPNL